MNKSELVDALAVHYDGSRADATRALNAFVQTISSAAATGERVAITGFGVFERVERPARTVRNPRTGERLDVPATAVPRFRAGTELKAYASGSRPVPELGAAPAAPARRASTAAAPKPAAPEPAAPEPAAEVPVAKTPAAKGGKAAKVKDEKPKKKAKDEKPKKKAKAKSDKKSKGKKK